ncbi:hypothetical protein [Pontibacter harenae]|uniref:hypothetical protein n=1 Tax=Pontibacter harenae TaxID=2894083 RepID=UPI001E6080CC|nr:hypothetical protein [Pontibacter harenae]MCC9165354.1 hypothetical protein [Pontibacter harenae]
MYNSNIQISQEKSIVQVAQNLCYKLLYNPSKNRVYFTIIGYWKNKDAVPEFLQHWKTALRLVKPNFTILTDMSSMITHPQELNDLHAQAHKLVMQAGVARTAHVIPADKIANLQAKAIADHTGFVVGNFATLKEADEWLNKVSVEY